MFDPEPTYDNSPSALCRPTADSRDAEILAARLAARANLPPGPRCGDYVREANGRETRITHVWRECAKDGGDIIQAGGGSHGRFHLTSQGHASYSGGLDPGFPGSELTLTDEVKPGSAWFFHHDFPGAGRGVDFMIDERVWVRKAAP